MNHKITKLMLIVILSFLTNGLWAQTLTPPPEPEISPVISHQYSNDKNSDLLDDELNALAIDADRILSSSQSQTATIEALNDLGYMADVELIFSEQITQKQIDDFLLLGGQIDYIYKAVSYGWQGKFPVVLLDSLPQFMGDTLVLIKGPKELEFNMDVATQTGRVRPIWAPGFAGRLNGFDGDPSITIGVIDTGVDGSHPDLSGRIDYWKDFSDDNESNAVDYLGHGSHVAGIACGTGQTGGVLTGLLSYTYYDSSRSDQRSSHYPLAVNIPVGTDFYSRVTWQGSSADFGILAWPEGMTIDDAYSSFPRKLETYFFSSKSSTNYIDNYINGKDNFCYTPFLQSNTNNNLLDVVITSRIYSYPSSPDNFNKFRGVAPGCKLAVAKICRRGRDIADQVQTSFYYCEDWWVSQALDNFIENRSEHGIKIINMSLGNPYDSNVLNTFLVNQINTAVNNGIIVTLSAGNDGRKEDPSIKDFTYAAKAITVGASNDKNALTDYSSLGFKAPADETEDYKPDLIAPGGSEYYTGIISVDSGTCDGYNIPDSQENDYAVMQGTSMSSPFVAGSAALVIDAMQQKGIAWDFYSDKHPIYVKMLLSATATETNMSREDNNGLYKPTLERGNAGPLGFPKGKDPYEGYGIINPDAAVEAACMDYQWGTTTGDTFGSDPYDRRAWARHISLSPDRDYRITLTNPSNGNYDLYIYSAEPGPNGKPVLLYCATDSLTLNRTKTIEIKAQQTVSPFPDDFGLIEQIIEEFLIPGNNYNRDFEEECIVGPCPGDEIPIPGYFPEIIEDENIEAIVVVKRISGYGSFTITGNTVGQL